MTEDQKVRACYYAAAIVVTLVLVVIIFAWHEHIVGTTGEAMRVKRGRPHGTASVAPHDTEKMSAGAHWGTAGSYGHTPSTLATYGYSGYYEDVPTPSWA